MGEEEIYQKLDRAKKIFKINREMSLEEDWENPLYRQFFGQEFKGDPTAYSSLASDVFRAEIDRNIISIAHEANSLLYNNFYKILKEKSEEEIADIMENIPLTIDIEKLEDKKLKEIAMLHSYVNTLKSLSMEDYKKITLGKAKKEGDIGLAYVLAGSTEHLLEIQKEQDYIYHKNILIGKLKELKKK
ncbi:MAG: hypothetical protein QXQ30_00555 [Candidatus Pacearchaeota archaeon]